MTTNNHPNDRLGQSYIAASQRYADGDVPRDLAHHVLPAITRTDDGIARPTPQSVVSEDSSPQPRAEWTA